MTIPDRSTPRTADPSRSVLAVLASLMAYGGYFDALNTAAAPHLALEFGLDGSGLARAFGWAALGSLASMPLARAADRVGRRRVLLLCVAALCPMAIASALSPSLWVFVVVQAVVISLKGVLMTITPVMVAEALPTARRAGGQALIGATGALGAGLSLIVVAAFADLPGNWRWGWATAALGVGLLPIARRSLMESDHYQRAAAVGDTTTSRVRELLGARYRARTLGILAVNCLFVFMVAGTQAWIIYHPVRNLGLEPWVATLVVIVGGGLALIGFPIGSRLSERWGRRYTFAAAGLLNVLAALAYYRLPADLSPSPVVGLAVTFAGMSLASAAGVVPLRAISTELFPTQLRGAIAGWIAVAIAAAIVIMNFVVAWLAASLGGIAPAASGVALAMLPAIAVILLLPETRGLELDQSAR